MFEIWNLNTICRCCHADGEFKSLQERYLVDNDIEIYSVMIRDTLGIIIDPPQIMASYMICDLCISQLRDAHRFKKQVMSCEQKFEEYCKNELCHTVDVKVESECVQDTDATKQEIVDVGTELDAVISMEELNPIQPRHECKKGNEIFSKEVGLERHLRTQKHAVNVCHVCSAPFSTYKELDRHLKKHTDTYTCQYCKKELKNAYAHKKHEKCHALGLYSCDLCNREFLYKNALRKHIMWHYGTHRQKICEICGQHCSDTTNLRLHVQAVHEKLRPYKCEHCRKTFFRQRHFLSHVKRHSEKAKQFSCDRCDKKFFQARSLEAHKLSHDNKWKCRRCNSIFAERKEYLIHLKDHIPNPKTGNGQSKYPELFKRIQCKICLKLLVNKYSFKRHMGVHRQEESRHKCDHCMLTFREKVTLQRHITRKHREVLKEACPICHKTFVDVENHMICHQGKPFKCDACLRTYSTNKGLTRHVKETHLTLDKYKCDLCEKQYKLLYNLKLHKIKRHVDAIGDVIAKNRPLEAS